MTDIISFNCCRFIKISQNIYWLSISYIRTKKI